MKVQGIESVATRFTKEMSKKGTVSGVSSDGLIQVRNYCTTYGNYGLNRGSPFCHNLS